MVPCSMQSSASSRAFSAVPGRRRGWWAAIRRRWPLLVGAIIVVAAVGVWRYEATRPPPPAQFKTADVVRRTIVGKVTASGTLSALVTVQVGTQVSGRIQKLFVDFNSQVKKGQPVAKIDPQLFQAAAAQAEANSLAAQAAVAKADSDAHIADLQLARARALHDQNLASQSDLDNAAAVAQSTHAAVDGAKASLAQALAQRSQAQINLSYTSIVSPIDGVVISRNVDVGQTVAASLSAPTLFTIAQDLTKMQVDTNVAEADVGRLQVGMATYFTVDAFPGQRFKGTIREIRNAAIMLQNVVTYDAVIDVDNSDLRLRPGMTANVTVTFAERRDAIAVPNAALRFHPTMPLGGAAAPSASHGQPRRRAGSDSSDASTLWVMRAGVPQPVSVHVGLTDGNATEVTDGDVREGEQVALEQTDTAGKAPPAGSSALRRLF
jgi:HlyD family secretion protein